MTDGSTTKENLQPTCKCGACSGSSNYVFVIDIHCIIWYLLSTCPRAVLQCTCLVCVCVYFVSGSIKLQCGSVCASWRRERCFKIVLLMAKFITECVCCLLFASTFYAIISKIFVVVEGTWSTVGTCFGFTLCTYAQLSLVVSVCVCKYYNIRLVSKKELQNILLTWFYCFLTEFKCLQNGLLCINQ